MDIIFNSIPNAGGLFNSFLTIVIYGGWFLVIWIVVKILFELYKGEIRSQFLESQEWIFLNVKAPRENLTSTLAVESIFAQMHALHTGITFAQQYVEGKTQLWYSLEIVSMGGKISFIIRAPKKQRDLVEAAIYAQYPTAEITEMNDYMENIDYDPDTSDFNLWGTEYKLVEDEVIPIKTYRDFEHPTAEEKIIDPLAAHFEALAKIQPHEFYGVQILIQPLADPDWKPKGENKVKELIGEEVPKEKSFFDFFTAPLDAFASFSFKDLFLGSSKPAESENKQKNNWQSMTESQKERVTLIERKIGKPGYKTKIRHLYIAPKERFDGAKKSIVIGSYRPLGSIMTNQFKPDTKLTWTNVEYKISPTLERPFIDFEEKRRKINMFKGYKKRDIVMGLPQFILNIEELATLYHFPLSAVPIAAAIEKTDAKKAQAPANLPVME